MYRLIFRPFERELGKFNSEEDLINYLLNHSKSGITSQIFNEYRINVKSSDVKTLPAKYLFNSNLHSGFKMYSIIKQDGEEKIDITGEFYSTSKVKCEDFVNFYVKSGDIDTIFMRRPLYKSDDLSIKVLVDQIRESFGKEVVFVSSEKVDDYKLYYDVTLFTNKCFSIIKDWFLSSFNIEVN